MERCGEIFRLPEGNYLFCCDNCGEQCETAIEIIKHIEAAHFSESIFCDPIDIQCLDSDSTTDNLKSELLQLELDEATQADMHTAALTEIEFEDMETPQMQESIVTPSPTTTTTLQSKSTDKPYECSTCSKRFQYKHLLYGHKRIVHKDKQLAGIELKVQCNLCDEEFSSPSKYRNHIRVHGFASGSSRAKAKVAAAVPSKLTTTTSNESTATEATGSRKSSLTPDLLALIDGTKCVPCNRTYANTTKVRRHIKLMHETTELKFTCTYCGHKFREKSNMRVHIRTHTGDRPYKCEVCGKGFAASSYLKIHKRFHNNDKPYQCSDCGKTFFTQSGLTEHTKDHTNVRPYKCAHCPNTYLLPKNLAAHEVKHQTGLFQCKLCGKTCNCSRNLQLHAVKCRRKHRIAAEYC